MSKRIRAIEDAAVIGDLHTAAIVASDGVIDFMCFPHFDSPSIFASILGPDAGEFRLSPTPFERSIQLYVPDTNVLITRFFLADGAICELFDFMPLAHTGGLHRLVRRVSVVRGRCAIEMACRPRPDYGAREPSIELEDGARCALFRDDTMSLRLISDRAMRAEERGAAASLELKQGDHATFLLGEARDQDISPGEVDAWSWGALEETINYWRRWTNRIEYDGAHAELVRRSALALKLMIAEPHGSLVAAPTFGLPEAIGGARNWDYRYVWLRDAAFTLRVLDQLGFKKEQEDFMRWLAARCFYGDGELPLRTLYHLDGSADGPERALDHLPGYRGSAPVRVGNGAAEQLQHDAYGALLDAIYLFDRHTMVVNYDLWSRLTELTDWICENWRLPDCGVWEMRGEPKEYLSGRVMSWVGIDRALRLAHRRSLPAPYDRWRAARDAIWREIHERYWDEEIGAFMMYPGSDAIDAFSLMMTFVNLISVEDARWTRHFKALRERLVWDDALVMRYRHGIDGFEAPEGAMAICSFWYVENLALMGRTRQAELALAKLIAFANQVGLYAEQIGPDGHHRGNFPQAFTHLALVTATLRVDRLAREDKRG